MIGIHTGFIVIVVFFLGYFSSPLSRTWRVYFEDVDIID